MAVIRQWVAALLAAASTAAAAAGQYSDLWWNPGESGWGINVVQQRETAFVTLFVYDANGQPTWYVAPDVRANIFGSDGPVLFTGALYRSHGPWQGGPFDARQVQATAVGHVDLEVLAKDRIRVHYAAEGVLVVKEVVRQTWEQAISGGFYAAQFVLRQARAPDGAVFGVRDYPGDVLVNFDAGEGLMRVDDVSGRRCEYRGPYVQTGKLLRFSGSYACSAGDASSGTFEASDFEFSDNGFTGYLRTWSSDINQSGRVAGVLR